MRTALTLFMLALSSTVSVAQFLPPMQAGAREEFDDYLKLFEATGADARVEAAIKFQKRWTRSELLTHVFYIEAESQRTLGRGGEAWRAAENALKAATDSIPALVLLAEIISNESQETIQLNQAQSYARRALELLETFRAPRSISLDELQSVGNQMRSRSHASLGLVAFKQGKTAEAIREFEIAEAATPTPAPVILYRLGKLYREAGRLHEAVAKMKQVVLMREAALKTLASKELEELQSRSQPALSH